MIDKTFFNITDRFVLTLTIRSRRFIYRAKNLDSVEVPLKEIVAKILIGEDGHYVSYVHTSGRLAIMKFKEKDMGMISKNLELLEHPCDPVEIIQFMEFMS